MEIKQKTKNLPGFTAESAVRPNQTCFGTTLLGQHANWSVQPQWNVGIQGAVCFALALAILAGQEELAPLIGRACFHA
jgi:hypothetical protein